MKKIFYLCKREFFLGVIYVFLFYIFCVPLISFCYEPVQTLNITKEDILNAEPISPFKVEFSEKELKKIKMMERRHFNKTYDNMSDADRLSQLEYELLDKTWRYTPKEERIKKLGIASSNVMLRGNALPVNLSSNKMVKRLRNDNFSKNKDDDVGLIDGFLRLISPEKYEIYKQTSRHIFEEYEY